MLEVFIFINHVLRQHTRQIYRKVPGHAKAVFSAVCLHLSISLFLWMLFLAALLRLYNS